MLISKSHVYVNSIIISIIVISNSAVLRCAE